MQQCVPKRNIFSEICTILGGKVNTHIRAPKGNLSAHTTGVPVSCCCSWRADTLCIYFNLCELKKRRQLSNVQRCCTTRREFLKHIRTCAFYAPLAPVFAAHIFGLVVYFGSLVEIWLRLSLNGGASVRTPLVLESSYLFFHTITCTFPPSFSTSK